MKYKLPQKPEDVLKLVRKIIKNHANEGAYSPLERNVIAKISFKLNEAQNLHDQGIKYQKIAAKAFAERDKYIGYKNHSKHGSNLLIFIKKTFEFLATHYSHRKKSLIKWGFKIG